MFNRKEYKNTNIYWPDELPDFLYASHKCVVGPKMERNIKLEEIY